MSQSYPFNVAADTNNGKVNPDILMRQLKDAALASGGTLEDVATDGGTDDGSGLITGGAMTVVWQNALSAANEAAQLALVSAHVGVKFGKNVARVSDESVSTTTLTAPQTKVTGSAGPLPAGDYLVTAYCELKVSAVVANSGVRGRVTVDANEVAQSNEGLDDQWHPFSAGGQSTFKAGDSPTFAITYERIGALNTVEIRRARLSIQQQKG